MAGKDDISLEETTKNQTNVDIITLSSDEEESKQDSKDVNFLFKRFILACRPHVTKETIKEARSLFTEVQGKLHGWNELGDMLERYGKEITKANADLYLNLICNTLNEKKSKNRNIISLDSVIVQVSENPVIDKVEESDSLCDVSDPRVFEPTPKSSTGQNNETVLSSKERPDISFIENDDDFANKMPSKGHIERVETMPSTSTAYHNDKSDKATGKLSIKTLTKPQRKKLAARLQQRLKQISNEIKILDKAELTLEEMDMSDSTYIKENRLKNKFEKTWNKLCKILGRPPNTGRVVEKPIRASSTGYSMIDKAVSKFLHDNPGLFPDYFDIRGIVLGANEKHDLRMSPQVLNGLIADIFTDVGNKLQKQREKDLLFNFGSHLLDDFKADDDPALFDEELAHRLEKNRKISKRNLKQVYSKYTHLERYKIDDKSRKHGSSEDDKDISDSGTSEDEQEAMKMKYTQLHHHEVKNKSRKRKGSLFPRPGTSRGVDRGVSCRSSSSDDPEDLSTSIDVDSVVVVDTDESSSQVDFVPVLPQPATINVESNVLDDTDVSFPQEHSDPPTMHEPLIKNVESRAVDDTDVSSIQEYSAPRTTKEPSTIKVESIVVEDTDVSSQEYCLSPAVPNPSLDISLTTSNVEITLTDTNCVDQCPASPTFPLCSPISMADVKTAELATDLQPSNDDRKIHKQTLSSCCDCEIINDTNQLRQLITPANEPLSFQNEPKTNFRNELKLFDEPLNESSFLDIKLNNDLQEQSVSVKQHEKPANELSVCESHSSSENDCLIIKDDQDILHPTTSHEGPCEVAKASAPNNELSSTLHALLNVFQAKDDIFDKSKHFTPMYNDSTNPGNTGCQDIPDRICEASINIDNENSGHPATSDVALVLGDKKCSTDSHKESVTDLTDEPLPKTEQTALTTCITSTMSPKQSETEQRNISSQSSPEGLVNPRKRKATAELAVCIPKSSVKCLEKIAMALKNKRLKVPDAWVNSNKTESISKGSLSIPTMPKESSSVSVGAFLANPPTTSAVTQCRIQNTALVDGKAKIHSEHRQQFREKTINGLNLPVNVGCKKECLSDNPPSSSVSNETVSDVVSTSNIVGQGDQHEVIVIDD